MAEDLTGSLDDDAGFHYRDPERIHVPVAYWPNPDDGYWVSTLQGPPLSPEDVLPELTEGMRVSISGRLYRVVAALPGGHYTLAEEEE